MKDCPSVSALAKELGIDRSNLYEWQRQLEQASESSPRVTSPVRELCKQVGELKRVLAEKTSMIDHFLLRSCGEHMFTGMQILFKR
jgi:transposase-like protein